MRGWLLASVDGKKTGLVPANYIKLLGRQHGSRHQAVTQPLPLPTLPTTMSSTTPNFSFAPPISSVAPTISSLASSALKPSLPGGARAAEAGFSHVAEDIGASGDSRGELSDYFKEADETRGQEGVNLYDEFDRLTERSQEKNFV